MARPSYARVVRELRAVINELMDIHDGTIKKCRQCALVKDALKVLDAAEKPKRKRAKP